MGNFFWFFHFSGYIHPKHSIYIYCYCMPLEKNYRGLGFTMEFIITTFSLVEEGCVRLIQV